MVSKSNFLVLDTSIASNPLSLGVTASVSSSFSYNITLGLRATNSKIYRSFTKSRIVVYFYWFPFQSYYTGRFIFRLEQLLNIKWVYLAIHRSGISWACSKMFFTSVYKFTLIAICRILVNEKDLVDDISFNPWCVDKDTSDH